MSTANSTSLRRTLAALALIGVLAFLSGFLQDTPYHFVNYIFFSLLFVGGFRLMRAAVQSTQTPMAKGCLLLTGVSTTLLFIAYVGYEWFRLNGDHQTASSIEGFMYLLVLDFGVGTMGSLGTLRGANA